MDFSPDILILGGGILGSSLAYHLSQRQAGKILVVDLDLAGRFSSSELNAGGCRATWWHPINVQLSWLSLNFYQTIASEIQFFQNGYLFLYTASKWQEALKRKELYRSLRIPVDYLQPADIHDRLPEFENLKGVAGATDSPRDGLLDPHLLREFYRQGAKAKGVSFQDRVWVNQIKIQGERVVEVLGLQQAKPIPEQTLENILTQDTFVQGPDWEKISFQPRVLVNCTGAWLPLSSRLYQRPLPIQAIRRQISLFASQEEDFSGRGMIVDASGLYFHPEGQHTGMILAGYSNRDEKPGYNFNYDGESFFDRKIWLRLYRRGARRHFAAVHHLRGWAGLYAVSPDRTGILWQVPELENLYEMGAATGRGVMQSYALGLSMAELITQGRFETLDATPLSGARFSQGNFAYENLDI